MNAHAPLQINITPYVLRSGVSCYLRVNIIDMNLRYKVRHVVHISPMFDH